MKNRLLTDGQKWFLNLGFKNIGAAMACLLFLSLAAPAKGQWLEPHRLKLGASAGFGGLHAWGKPSIDLHWNRLCARFSPGLYYIGGGLTYKLAFFNPKERTDRVLTLSAYYMNDWFLSNRRRNEFGMNQHIYMLMPGIHVNLNHRGTIYMEVSAGPMYLHEITFNDDKSVRSARDHWSPMGEIRFGGLFLRRKEHVQQFPLKYKKKKAEKIKKRKLEFKD